MSETKAKIRQIESLESSLGDKALKDNGVHTGVTSVESIKFPDNTVLSSASSVGDVSSSTNVGTGVGLYKDKVGSSLRFKTLKAGSNITVTLSGSDEVSIAATNLGEVNTASSAGTGTSLIKGKTGSDIAFKSLKAGSNITLTAGADDITIVGTGEANTGSNVGASGAGVYINKVGADLRFRKLVAGTNVTIQENVDTITISSSGGSGGVSSNQLTFPDTDTTRVVSGVSSSTTTSLSVWNQVGQTAYFGLRSGLNYASNYKQLGMTVNPGSASASIYAGSSSNDSNPPMALLLSSESKLISPTMWTAALVSLLSGNGGGKVGINNTNPAYALDVNGTINIRSGGVLRFPDGTTMSTAASGSGSGTGEANTASSLGTGTSIFSSKVGVDLRFKSLVAGSGVTITNDTNTVTISSTGGGTGAGSLYLTTQRFSATAGQTSFAVAGGYTSNGVLVWRNGVLLAPSRYIATNFSSVTLTHSCSAGDEIAIAVQASGGTGGTGSGEINTASNLGTGYGIFASKTGVDLAFKSLKAGTGVTITSTSTELTINASGGGGGSATGWTSVLDYGADKTGVASSVTAFNNAAIASKFVYVPPGTYLINSAVATSATWFIAAGATITGLTAIRGIDNTSRLPGRVMHAANKTQMGFRFGSSDPWLENVYWPYSESIAELVAISGKGGTGLLGASRASHAPVQDMGTIGIAGHSVNDSTSVAKPAWAAYLNHQRTASTCGPSYGLEIDCKNNGNVFDLKPYNVGNPYVAGGQTVNLWLSSGAEGATSNTSAAIAILSNPRQFRRGIVVLNGAIDNTINECLTMFNGGRVAWYDSPAGIERMTGYITSGEATPGVAIYGRNADLTTYSGVALNRQGDKSFAPTTDKTITLGTAGSRWGTMYGNIINLDGYTGTGVNNDLWVSAGRLYFKSNGTIYDVISGGSGGAVIIQSNDPGAVGAGTIWVTP